MSPSARFPMPFATVLALVAVSGSTAAGQLPAEVCVGHG